MDELGNLLREAREARGLTLAEAQETTRISSKYLEALENGQYEDLPTPTHVRGYMRNYARFLALDPQPLLDRYELSRSRKPAVSPVQTAEEISGSRPIPPRDDQVFYDPVNLELTGSQRRDTGSFSRLLIIAALIIALVLVAVRFLPMMLGNGDGTEALTESLQEAVSNITGEGEATVTPDTSIIPGAGQAITSTNRNNTIQLPTPTATRPALPAVLETIRLRLEITERSWMRVTIDGEVVFEGLVRRGDEPYEWEAQQEAQLLTGNGAGIFVTINDVALGRLGGRGEVVEEIWTATGTG